MNVNIGDMQYTNLKTAQYSNRNSVVAYSNYFICLVSTAWVQKKNSLNHVERQYKTDIQSDFNLVKYQW